VLVSAAEVIVAVIIAVPLGALIGVAIAESDYFGQIFKPLLFYVFSVPKSIFLPMFILIMGIGFQQKVAYAAFSTLFVVIMSATAAVESVKADHVLVARSYGATRMQILTRVYVPSMMPILLETLRISMIFNFTGAVPALTDISMSVDAGRFVVIVGPSGCGKTSLLMMMAGLRHQTCGTIHIQRQPIDTPDPHRVGVVFQEASLFPWLSALDNIEF